jgi:hypothetical protein
MFSLSSLSRRALIAVAAFAAVAPKAEAGSSPQAFVAAALSDVRPPDASDLTKFPFFAQAALWHPASGRKGDIDLEVFVSIGASADQARKQVVSQLKNSAVQHLKVNNVTVAKDRVHVVLF